jgi:hypothetical protein
MVTGYPMPPYLGAPRLDVLDGGDVGIAPVTAGAGEDAVVRTGDGEPVRRLVAGGTGHGSLQGEIRGGEKGAQVKGTAECGWRGRMSA